MDITCGRGQSKGDWLRTHTHTNENNMHACVVPQLKAPALPLWGHIPRLKRPRTSRRLGCNAFITRMHAEHTNSSLQVRVSRLKPSKCSSIEHRLCAAAANDRISNRRRTVSSSLISLNRYTTLKIAGAAHKLSTSRFSEPTFWKLPGTGHKMTIKVVTLSKVCDPFCVLKSD